LTLKDLGEAILALSAPDLLGFAHADLGQADALCLASRARLAELGFDPANAEVDSEHVHSLESVARLIITLGPVSWACSALPWSPATGFPDARTVALVRGARFKQINRPLHPCQAEALALMAAVGAFESGLPTLARVRAQACVGGDDHQRLRVLALDVDPVPEERTQEHLAERVALKLSNVCPLEDQVVVIAFDVDDQSPEDLSIALERIRGTAGVLDVTLGLFAGKKGRTSFRVELLARPEYAPDAIRACFEETTTIGLRWHISHRVLLQRTSSIATGPDGSTGAIKTVLRPGGDMTSKAEADVLASSGLNMAGRRRLRAGLESTPPATVGFPGNRGVG
jgi:hypothetical protein